METEATLWCVQNGLTHQYLFELEDHRYEWSHTIPERTISRFFSSDKLRKLNLSGCILKPVKFKKYIFKED